MRMVIKEVCNGFHAVVAMGNMVKRDGLEGCKPGESRRTFCAQNGSRNIKPSIQFARQRNCIEMVWSRRKLGPGRIVCRCQTNPLTAKGRSLK